MITLTNDPGHLKQICELVPKVKDAEYTSREFMIFLIKNNGKYLRAWIDLEGDNVKSFLVAQIVRPCVTDEIFIPLSFVSPNSNGVGEEFLNRVIGWGQSKGIKKISAYIKRNPNAFERKYGFKIGFTEIYKTLNY